MVTHTARIETGAEPESVLAYVADPAHLADWHHFVASVDPTGVDTADLTVAFYGRQVAATARITREATTVTIETESPKFVGTDLLQVVTDADGRWLEYTSTIRTKGSLRLLAKGLAPVVERAVDKGISRIAALTTG